MADNAGDESYRGWLGGYAKSVAGSVANFTQDILEETRQDTQDVDSQLKVAQDNITGYEKKVALQNDELGKVKRQLLEAVDSKEVTELQLQELGNRWKRILQDKEEELKQMKEKVQELETEREKETKSPQVTRSRNYSGDLDFSDPFLCEMEIGRLYKENGQLSRQLEEHFSKVEANRTNNENNDGIQSKIQALEAQLRAVYNEHANELLEKEHATQQVISDLKSHYDSLLQDETRGQYPILANTGDEQTELLEDKITDLQQQLKREKAYFKQVEDEKTRVETEKRALSEDIDKLNTKIGELESHISGLIQAETRYSEEIRAQQCKIGVLETQAQQHEAAASMISQHYEHITELQQIIEHKTKQCSGAEVKLMGTELLLSNREKEIQQLRIALNTVQSEDFQELRGLADSLKTQVEGYKESLKETGHKLLESNKQYEDLAASNNQLVTEGAGKDVELTELTERIQHMSTQIEENKTKSAAQQQQYETVNDKLTVTSEQLANLTSEKETLEKSTNKLKAEKLEMVVELKSLKGQNQSLESVSCTLADLKQNPLFSILDETVSLSESQIEQIKQIAEITSGEAEGPVPVFASSPKTTALSVEDLKSKLADKSEQLQLLQTNVNKLKSEKDAAVSELQNKNTELEEWLANSLKELLELKTRTAQYQTSAGAAADEMRGLEEEVGAVRSENEMLKEQVGTLSQSASNHQDMKLALENLEKSANKEKSRLLQEIERLMAEMSEVEELYSSSVADKQHLELQLVNVKETLATSDSDKELLETKLGKVNDNLKKTLARLAVKDAKIDELVDQVTQLETKLVQSSELLDFFKNNQTDEIKAAQLGLITPECTAAKQSEVTTFQQPDLLTETQAKLSSSSDAEQPQKTSPTSQKTSPTSQKTSPTSQKTEAVAGDMKVRLGAAAAEITDLKQRLTASNITCTNLVEKTRDQDLKIELLAAEVASVTEAGLSTTDTNKLLDQNMTFQRRVGSQEKELDTLKHQSLEILHQRDFYQDQAKQFHSSMETLRSEANKLINEANEREKKTLSDFERLQQHLVEAEKTHTEEFLDITKRESGLRAEMGGIREDLLTSNSALNALRAERAEETGGLTEQLQVIATQRDNALLQLCRSEDRMNSAETSLTNLQIALEQFQQDREGYAAEIHDQYKRDIDTLSQKLDTASDTISRLEARVSEIKLIEKEFEGCKNDTATKEELIKSLQTEVSKLDVALKVAQEGLQKARTTSEDKVERSLMKSFFTQYLIAPDHRKPEVLRLMTSILKFTEEELTSLNKQKDNKWLLNNLFTAGAGPEGPVPTGESFSELFISFLETEANRGTMLGTPVSSSAMLPSVSRAASTPPTLPYSHRRTLSTASNKSIPSSGVSVSSTAESEPPSFNIGSSSAPVVVPQSLAELLNNKPR